MTTSTNSAEAATRFASVAQEFCSVIDSAPDLKRLDLLVRVYGILPQLIGEAIRLPAVDLNEAESEEEESKRSRARANSRLNHAQFGLLYESLKAKLGDLNLYWQIWDPTKYDEAIHGALADDFADIYNDLKEGLNLFDAHQALPEENIWHWRFDYYFHWGKHAIDALRALHFLLEEGSVLSKL